MDTCRQCGRRFESGKGYLGYCCEGCARTAEIQKKQLNKIKEQEQAKQRAKTLEKIKGRLVEAKFYGNSFEGFVYRHPKVSVLIICVCFVCYFFTLGTLVIEFDTYLQDFLLRILGAIGLHVGNQAIKIIEKVFFWVLFFLMLPFGRKTEIVLGIEVEEKFFPNSSLFIPDWKIWLFRIVMIPLNAFCFARTFCYITMRALGW